mmetsp:Transcript_27206/g.49731  ORF Transcript_27206/g.49731 Transcript_27206/m.49731 type:complete len:328 (+) Transcript_27206:482-1465(+)
MITTFDRKVCSNGRTLPLLATDEELAATVTANYDAIQDMLRTEGAVVVQGTAVVDAEGVEEIIQAVGEPPMEYLERSTPRRSLGSFVYSSTEFPADQTINLHNELSAAHVYPRLVWFYCRVASETGGATTLCDSRAVAERLPTDLREKFERLGWRLVRRYNTGFSLRWQEAFATEDRSVVEDYCRSADIAWTWQGDEVLETVQVRSAFLDADPSGRSSWFNHVAFWHYSSMPPAMISRFERDGMLDQLPFDTTFGDGSPISPEEVDILRNALTAEEFWFDWTPGELLILDNRLVGHGRQSYSGDRTIVTALTTPERRPDFAQAGPVQ